MLYRRPVQADWNRRRRELREFSRRINEVLTLKRHTVLNRNAAAQGFYTLDVPIGDRSTMVKEPVEAIKRDLAVDFLVDVQSARDRFFVSRVQTERPAVCGQVPDYRF